MTSTTVAQHTTQPLNFGPEWLRALSTPESTTPMSAAGGNGSGGGAGNVFKFTTTKYRYSRDEILALRSNVTERLSEGVKNEILENLKDVESVFRPNILEPLALTIPSAEENSKMNSLSNYISGRSAGGGGGRGGGSSQPFQQQQHDVRSSRGGGGGSMSNGRGGPRGRGGRENSFGANRGNANAEDNGENGGNDDNSVPSSSWSSRGGHHSRGGGAFGNRIRSYDDRSEQSQSSFRRGGGPRQTSDGWRKSRGDDEENADQNEEPSTAANGSSSWTSRGGAGQTRRGGGSGPLDQRTKSNDKWNTNEDRPGQSSSFESNQQRGWRTMCDRDLNSRRPQPKRDRMPEWMDDANEGDHQLSNATFEQDGTFTGLPAAALRQNSNEQQKFHTQSSVDEAASSSAARGNALPSKQQDDSKPEKSVPSQIDKAVVNVPTASEKMVSEPTPPVQQPHTSWEDEFEPSDVATLVVESTLADDHDYSPPVSANPTPHPISMDSTLSSSNPLISQSQRTQPPVMIDDKQWFYKDPQNTVQGPFSSADMERWFAAGYFNILLPVKRLGEAQFSTIQQLTKELGRLPFRADAPAPMPPPMVAEPQKFNPMTYSSSSTTNSTFLDGYLMQPQRQPNPQPQAMLFNRQTSVPAADRKPVSSPSMITPQLQAYFASQQQHSHSHSASSLFPSNLVNDSTMFYQPQAANQLHRSTSVTNQQNLFDDIQQSFRPISSQSNTAAASSSFFGSNLSSSQSQQATKPDDIMTRLAQAMQNHGQQQQDKLEDQRRFEQQRRDLELERLKLTQQAEQLRLQREEEEQRQLAQHKLEEELRKKKETQANKQMIFDQVKEMAKTMDQKKQQQQPVIKPQPAPEIDPFIAFQQSLQYQKEQQAKIDAQKAENVRRYQQQQQQQQQTPPAPTPQQTFKLPDAANWARHSSQSAEQNQPMNFAEIQKQEQEQERRARDAALAAQQLAKSEAVNIPSSSSSSNAKSNSWARTLFAGGSAANSGSQNLSSDHDPTEYSVPESPSTSYNQQATNAVLSLLNIHPKSRAASNQQSAPWNASSTTPSTSLQDIQRQQQIQSQNEPKPPSQQPQQQQTHSSSSAHSALAWGGVFQHSTPSPQSSSSIFWGNESQPSTSSTKSSSATSGNKPSTPWTELKSAASVSSKPHSTPMELTKSEREVKTLFSTARTQDALSKWAQTQFKDNLQAIDVPTLVQLLKDIETAEEIVEYVQPYIGSVVKAKEFARDFIGKRKQLAKAEPELDNERLTELAMVPTAATSTSSNPADEGFQLASSNGQKKKAKKMKGQKIDVKQLGFMVNNRPEQRDDIDRVQM